jgi:triphosphoribosyl-dephospho-CoA synthase
VLWSNDVECGRQLADLAVKALIDEAELTPKPGLVDMRSAGCHDNMNIALMRASALSLHDCFASMGTNSFNRQPDRDLRESLALIGRLGEQRMLQVTNGVNTHRGAIWAIGLLIAGAAIRGEGATAEQIANTAGHIARFPDRNAPKKDTNGLRAMRMYGIQGARGEAMNGFPHVIRIGLTVLQEMRVRYVKDEMAKLNALLAIMASLEDSCLLHRGGLGALIMTQQGAQRVLELGGADTEAGWRAYLELEANMHKLHASPGGSADLLAAVLFLDGLHLKASNTNEERGALSRGTTEISI